MKIIRIAAIACFAVVAVAALALVFGIPVGFLLAGTIQKQVKAETGYRMVISGDTWLVLRPSLRLQIRNVALLDDDDRAQPRRLTVDSVRIDASASSLLSGRPRLTEIAVVRPTFFAPLVRERIARSSTPAARAGASRSASDVTVDRFVIEDGTLVFSDHRGAVEGHLDHIDATASLSGSDDAVELRATARAGEQTLGLSVKGKILGLRLDGQSIPLEFSFEAPGLLQDAAPGVADFKAKGSSIAINGLAGTIGQNKFSGSLSVDFASKPLVRMDVNFERLDIAVVQPAASPSGAIEVPANLDQPWSDTKINLDVLNFFDAEMQFSSAELSLDRYRFAPISVAAILTDGVLRGAVTQTNGYGGQIQGTLSVDATSAEPSHALRVDVIGVQALPFLSAVADFPYLDGRMVARIDARGRGTNTRAIMSTLGGAVDVRFEDGEIGGLNVSKMIRTVAASILSGWNESRSEKTDLSQLSAFFRMEGGRATTDNLRVVGPLVRVSGAGTADIGAKTLQFRLDPKLVMSLEGQGSAADPVGLGVPVVVQGSWGAPRIYPEIAGILDNPEAAFGRLRELGSGLFGTSPGQSNAPGGSLIQGIESLFGSKDSAKQPPAASQSQPPASSRPQPSSPQPAPSSQSGQQPKSQDSQTQIRDMMRDLMGR